MTPKHHARPPAYQVLADDLRLRITSGELRPGDRLPTEPELGHQSGLSRSTVREALRLLASQHLIVTTRGVAGGSFVGQPSPDQLAASLSTGVELLLANSVISGEHLFEIRATLEIPAAALAARRRTEQDLAAIEATLFDPATTDVDTMLVTNREFHLVVAAATRNPLYGLICRPLYRTANDRELVDHLPAGFWVTMDAEHRAIAHAIRERQPDEACTAARRHVAHLRATFARRDIQLRTVTPWPEGIS